MDYIDFSTAPEDPIERLVWLGGLDTALRREVDRAWAETYFDIRLKGMLPQAIALRFHSKKRILAWCRRQNEARGRVVARWNDGY